jgi:hypothetical protein
MSTIPMDINISSSEPVQNWFSRIPIETPPLRVEVNNKNLFRSKK